MRGDHRSRYNIHAMPPFAVTRRRGSVLAVVLVTDLACRTSAPQNTTPPELTPGPVSAPESQGPPVLDGARMTADIAFLASDEMHGRHTLGPDLRRAAEFLAQRYTELGLAPVGAGFQVEFPLTVGAKVVRPPALTVHRGAKGVPATGFAALPQSASGEVRGPLVFVGYAARSDPEAEGKAPAYDDLAGVDLKGKVAVILLDAPGRPDSMALLQRMQEDAQRFAEAAKPLKEKKDAAGLKALHGRARAELLALVDPYIPKDRLKDVWLLPEDPLAVEYNPMAVAGGLLKAASELPGPRFGFAEGTLRTKVERVAAAGAVGAIVVRGPRSFVSPEARKADELPKLRPERPGRGSALDPLPVPVVQMQWSAADKLPGKPRISQLQAEIDRDKKPRSGPISGVEVSLSVALEPETVAVPNVLAKLAGGDRAEEIVLIGAHYDHIGEAPDDECSEARSGDVVDKICNGADDNASGTAMVLELARLMKQSGRAPRRTIVFTHFAGEELGILGSKALVADPPFDLTKVVAMVNLDMVGRYGPRGLAIGGLGSSQAWLPLLEEIGTAGLDVLYEGSVATRSDHASFYRKDIPVLFFFTFTHPDYHRPGDTIDKINLDGMLAIGQIVGGVMQRLGDGHVVPFNKEGHGLAQGLPGNDPKTIIKKVKAGAS